MPDSDESSTPVNGIRPPKQLVFSNDMSTNWKNWIQQFEWYAIATQLNKKAKEVQAATFMTTIGPDAIQVFNNFNLTPQQQTDVEIIKEKFKNYFIPKINLSFERYNFFKITQKEGETLDDFLNAIKTQAKTCEFEGLHDSLLKDKIVFGVYSDQVREKLLTESDLTLDKAIAICRASEQATKQLKEINNAESQQVNILKNKSKQSKKEEFNCRRCGTKHGRQNCPAYKSKCEKCQKLGHFANSCWAKTNKTQSNKSKKINLTEAEEEEEVGEDQEETFYVSKVTADGPKDWQETIYTGTNKLVVKLDSGAQCNVLSKELVQKLKAKIQPSSTKRLISFTEHKIPVIGEVKLDCKVKNQRAEIVFKVVDEKVQSILGKESCEQLKLISRVNEVNLMELNDEELYQGLGCIKNFEYDIDFIDDPKFEIIQARKVPHSISQTVKEELDKMVEMGVIKPTTEPTPAVSPIVIVRKNKKIRICIDPTDVNKNILRRHYPLKTIEEISTRLSGSKYFTKLDCKRGFWQIKVSERTQKYLTFSTPWGRYSCTRLPFGLSSAPEVFQQAMNAIIKDLPNVECSMDDSLIHARTQEELEKHTQRVLKALKDAGLKLNKDKCVFKTNKVKFLGHIISERGLEIDPEKVEAIKRLQQPEDKAGLQRLLGMVTYLNKFIPKMSELTEPLRELLKKEVAWSWEQEHTDAVRRIKETLSTSPVLKFYDVNAEVTLSVDASSKSLGAVLLQEEQPVAYATKALTSAQQNYPQIEKEALAIKTACTKFHEYIYGKKLTVETDHKPLESIFKKPLYKAPPRLQRIIFDVRQYSSIVVYKKGTDIPIADALSRDCKQVNNDLQEEELEVQIILAMSKEAREEMTEAVRKDDELQTLLVFIQNGFPDTQEELPNGAKPYFNFRDELSYYNGLIFKGEKVVVPKSQIPKMLKNVHAGHLGIQSCLRRARELLYWRGQYKDIENYVERCKICQQTQKSNDKQPVATKDIPTLPWQIVATDLFYFRGREYIVICDSYSGFIDFKPLKTETSSEIIGHLKNWFSTHGVPEILESDNGPQYTSKEFKEFRKTWYFQSKTSSPNHPRGNGLAERGVQTAKGVLRRCTMDNSDIQLALLNLRNTPRNDQIGSPNQRLMSRMTRTNLPTSNENLKPKIVENVSEELKKLREKQKFYSDRTSRVTKDVEKGDKIRVQFGHRNWLSGQVTENTENPRSVIIQTDSGKTFRRNTSQLHKTKATITETPVLIPTLNNNNAAPEEAREDPTPSSPAPEVTAPPENKIQDNRQYLPAHDPVRTTRLGRVIKPVQRMNL